MASSPSDNGSDQLDANEQQISKIEIEPYYTQYDQLDEPEAMEAGHHSKNPTLAAIAIEYVQCSGTDVRSATVVNEVNYGNTPMLTATQVDKQPLPPPKNDDDSNLGAEFRSDFFAHIESKASAAVLPVYLKHLLTLNGYDNVVAFSTLDVPDILQLEHFGRTELLDLLRELVPTLRQDQLPKFFHMFWRNPSNFRILAGHRQMLLQVAKYCDELWSNRWSQVSKTAVPTYKSEEIAAVAVVPKQEQRSVTQNVSHEYMDESEPDPMASETLAPTHSDNDDDEKHNPRSSEHTNKHSRSTVDLINFVNRSLRAHFTAGTHGRVLVRRANAANGTVQCSICKRFTKLSFSGPPNDRRPVVSNMMRHMKRHFTKQLDKVMKCPPEKWRNRDEERRSDDDSSDNNDGPTRSNDGATGSPNVATGVSVSSVVTKSDEDLLRFANRIIEKNLRDYTNYKSVLLSSACAAASTIQCSVCRMYIKIEKRLAMDGLSRWFAPNFVRHMRGHLSQKTTDHLTARHIEPPAPSESEGDNGPQTPSNVVTKCDADLLAFVNKALESHFDSPNEVVANSAKAVDSVVRCSICERDVKVQIRRSGVLERWVASNFVRHMKNHFPGDNGAIAEKPTIDHNAADDDDEDRQPLDLWSNSGMAMYLNRSVRRHFAANVVGKLLIQKANATVGSVQCRICHRYIKVASQKRGKNFRWLVSNVLRHFNTHYPRLTNPHENI